MRDSRRENKKRSTKSKGNEKNVKKCSLERIWERPNNYHVNSRVSQNVVYLNDDPWQRPKVLETETINIFLVNK